MPVPSYAAAYAHDQAMSPHYDGEAGLIVPFNEFTKKLGVR